MERLGLTGSGGIKEFPAMKSADSGVKSPQPGGELSEGKEGERQRGSWPFYTRGRGVD
jgi:hypothetical protein